MPISEDDFVRFGLAIDATQLTLYDTTPQAWKDYVTQFGGSTSTILATGGWARNTIDSRIYPMKGSSYSLGAEVGLPGGSLKYYRTTFGATRYFPMAKDQTLMVMGSIGIGGGYSGRPLPFTKNFYAGGIGSVRGYDSYSLGPVDPTTDSRLGGSKQIIGSGEYLFPMPGIGKDKSVRLGAFVDAGQVWATGTAIKLNDLRYSAGLSANWNSPFGPLKFSFGQPLNKKEGDKVQRLQFTMGTAF
jgi:outer membrane protein insertion porin family